MLTQKQVEDRTKTVTRRVGWWFLKPGDLVTAVDKGMGLKKGQKSKRLASIRIVDVREERLNQITREDVVKEGFPGMSPAEFVSMFCSHMKGERDQKVNRIEFEYLDGEA
ncbi:ASCH domain-containing protein [Thalassoglobus neptunius]|nr:ASCH domain-containing protein [Thalassoglobus neptunius]